MGWPAQLLLQERGELSLEYLHGMDDVAAKAELMRFKGVGPKTVACVLMFTLARAEFPVDAHVVGVSLSMASHHGAPPWTMVGIILTLVAGECCKTDLHAATDGPHAVALIRCALSLRRGALRTALQPPHRVREAEESFAEGFSAAGAHVAVEDGTVAGLGAVQGGP